MKKIIILFLLIIYSSVSHAGTQDDFNKIDNMLKKGYITKSECVKLKSDVMGKKLPKTICDKVKKGTKNPQFQISSHINKLFSGNGLFIIIIAIVLFIFYLKRSSISNFFISSSKGLSTHLKKSENRIKQKSRKPLFSGFKLKQKSLVVPALFVIIAILSFDKFSNFSFNNSKDEYKNVNFNSLSSEEKRAYTCIMTYGFKKGSSDFKNCVFKIAQAELELQRLDEQRRIAEAQIRAAQEANQQAKLQALRSQQLALEQQRRQSMDNASNALINLGLGLLTPQQNNSIKTNCSMWGHTWTCTSR